MSAYGQHDPDVEKRRLRLQAEVLEPLSERVLDRLGSLEGARILDVACGAMGLLRALSRRVGAAGRVVGTDVNDAMVASARAYCAEQGLANVQVVQEDAYASTLLPRSFDVVHARLILAPVGRDDELAAQLARLVRPGGWIVLEEPDSFDSWRIWPDSTAHTRLWSLLARAFDRHMGGAHAGARLLPLARSRGWEDIHFDAQILGMPPGHPYLHLPVMMATALRSALLLDTPADELDRAVADARAASERPDAYGISYTLMQVWARAP